MEDLNDKITGGTVTAAQWNQLPSEIQNVIEALGIALSGGDLNQLGKGIAGYVANGNFYTDSGVADAYVLSTVGLKQSAPAYTDGFTAVFTAGNTNTGPTTVNVGGLGVVNVFNKGAACVGGEFVSGNSVTIRYDAANTRFNIDAAASPPATIAGYSASTKTYLSNVGAVSAPVPFDIDAAVTPITAETIGPTGSGATHIWSELDALPGGINAILVNIFMRADATAAGPMSSYLSAIDGDVVASGSILDQVAAVQGYASAAGQSVAYLNGLVLIPLNASKVFSVYYGPNGGAGDFCTLYLEGWTA
jgi:hypothetical protein